MPSLDNLGWDPFFASQVTEDEHAHWTPGRIVWDGRSIYRLSTGDLEWEGRLAGRFRHEAAARAELPVVGDWVLAAVRPAEGSATIHRRLARRSRFSRGAAGRSTDEHVIAANIDTVLLITSFNRDFSLRRIERYLALAWESGATPVIVLNKVDLLEDHATLRSEMTTVAQGVPVLVTSAVRGDGIDELRETVRTGGTTALLGSSGVGKSTLTNALMGADCIRQDVRPVREADDRGRHSTTARQLFAVPGGGVLIDTPGMRELQLWDAQGGLEHAFADVESLSVDCRFRDCSHESEPGCAVTAAVARGDLTDDRLDSYRRLQREDEFLRLRHDEGARLERTRKAKHIAKAIKLHDKLRRR